ncbi:hypothetical protein [Mycobacteroides abscessus]
MKTLEEVRPQLSPRHISAGRIPDMTRGAFDTGIQMAQSHLAPPPAPLQSPEYPHHYMQAPYPYKRQKNWTPVALVAAIIVAGALIAGAILLAGGDRSGVVSVPSQTGQPAAAPAVIAESATCRAWSSTKQDLSEVPLLPEGWKTDPNREIFVQNQINLLAPIMDRFEKSIVPEPANVAAAARNVVATQRASMASLKNGTFVSAQADQGDAAYAQMDAVCVR